MRDVLGNRETICKVLNNINMYWSLYSCI